MNPLWLWLGGLSLGLAVGLFTSLWIWPRFAAQVPAPGPFPLLPSPAEITRLRESQKLFARAVSGDLTALHTLGARAGIVTMTGYPTDGMPWATADAREFARVLYGHATRILTEAGKLAPPAHGTVPQSSMLAETQQMLDLGDAALSRDEKRQAAERAGLL